MFSIKEMSDIYHDIEANRWKMTWLRIIDDLKFKPGITINQEEYIAHFDKPGWNNRRGWYSKVVNVIQYLGVGLNCELTFSPMGVLVKFPTVTIWKRSKYNLAKWRETWTQIKASSTQDTEILFNEIVRAHRRYVLANKRKEKKLNEYRAATGNGPAN